jgi:hypothetical protein
MARVRSQHGENLEVALASLEDAVNRSGSAIRDRLYEELSETQSIHEAFVFDQALAALGGLDPRERAEFLSEAAGVPITEDDLAKAQARAASFAIKRRVGAAQYSTPGEFKRDAIYMGAALWPIAQAALATDDLEGVVRRVWDEAKRQGNDGLMEGMQVPEIQRHIVFAARWAKYAFPVVQLQGHRYAAALMSTQPSAEEPTPPWPTFLLEVPIGLVSTIGRDNIEQPIEVLFVSRYEMPDGLLRWDITAAATDGTSLQRTGDFGVLFVPGDKLSVIDTNPAFQVEYDHRDDRVWWLLGRLLANTCIAMSDPNEVRTVGRNKSALETVPGDPDTSKIYRVGHAVEVDCRQAVHEFLVGMRRTGPTVRFVVRGHWRDQACGPRLGERRKKWIEPYWKGPEAGAINVRPYVVGGSAVPGRDE